MRTYYLCQESVNHYLDGHDSSSSPAPIIRCGSKVITLESKDEKGKVIGRIKSSISIFNEIPLDELVHAGQSAEMWSLENQIASGVSLAEHNGSFIGSDFESVSDAQSLLNNISDSDLDSALGVTENNVESINFESQNG